MTDEHTTADPGTPEADLRKPVEAWESEKDVEPWLRVATRTLHRWARGRELTEREYDEGIERTRRLVLG